MDRTLAFGDIHGCSSALAALLDAIQPDDRDTLIFLGDFIDRGPDSRGVLDRIVSLTRRCPCILLLGNHEEMLAAALRDRAALKPWLISGGVETLTSYGWVPGKPRRGLIDWIDEEHRRLLEDCVNYHETDSHFFVHAGYLPDLPLAEQPGEVLRWRVTDRHSAQPHGSGKTAIVGHTPQRSGEILDLGFLICIDTNCHRGGWLTALDVHSKQVWQADSKGRMRP